MLVESVIKQTVELQGFRGATDAAPHTSWAQSEGAGSRGSDGSQIIARWELGARRPNRRALRRLERYFGVERV